MKRDEFRAEVRSTVVEPGMYGLYDPENQGTRKSYLYARFPW